MKRGPSKHNRRLNDHDQKRLDSKINQGFYQKSAVTQSNQLLFQFCKIKKNKPQFSLATNPCEHQKNHTNRNIGFPSKRIYPSFK